MFPSCYCCVPRTYFKKNALCYMDLHCHNTENNKKDQIWPRTHGSYHMTLYNQVPRLELYRTRAGAGPYHTHLTVNFNELVKTSNYDYVICSKLDVEQKYT